ncbi:MAG: hypothetical protein H6733_10360 [Alphaproteobacteria bacterium]|nr:hypothetical protein [Alphaproteobacteria bacterium]
MARPLAHVPLAPGTVYRTAWLRRWGANPTRLAQKLADQGLVRRLGHGLLYAPRTSRFGEVPPSDEALLDAFLDGSPYVVTGPERWNALGLGSTSLFARPLVYNTKRTGTFELGGRTFELRRVAFPTDPPPEWFVVDLLRHADAAGVDRDELVDRLCRRVRAGRFDTDRLFDMAARFGTTAELEAVRAVTSPAAP